MREIRMIPFYENEILGIYEALDKAYLYFYDGQNPELEEDLLEAKYRIEVILKERGETVE